MPPRRRWQLDPKIAADLRPSADGSALFQNAPRGDGIASDNAVAAAQN